jgi:hypothetical protein
MKKLVDLIEIEKSFVKEAKAIKSNHQKTVEHYIIDKKNTIDMLEKEILNKNEIVSSKLSAHQDIIDIEKQKVQLDHKKIQKIILTQL